MRKELTDDDIEATFTALCEAGRWESNLTIETLAYIDRDWGYYALLMAVEWEGEVYPNWDALYSSLPENAPERPEIIYCDNHGFEDDIFVFVLIQESGPYDTDLSPETLVRIYKRWGQSGLLKAVRYHRSLYIDLGTNDTPFFIEEAPAQYVVN